MWIRKRIDISWRDLSRAAVYCLMARRADVEQTRVEALWSESALACLSVRSGWDLLLQATAFPPGSEVLVSALTIPDMVRIIEDHGLVPVPLDVETETALPSPETIEAGVTPNTRAVLLAHLFGATAPLDRHVAVARRHGLLFVEDCAQAFRGLGDAGHPQADASLVSFGFIKTATALGGAVTIVRRPDLLNEMRRRQHEYPIQPKREHLRRGLHCAVLKLLSSRIGARSLLTLLRICGRNVDRFLNSRTRGFPRHRMFEMIRRRPSTPLLRLLRRRIEAFDIDAQQAREQRGRRLVRQLEPVAACPAADVEQHAFWVIPVLVEDPEELRRKLLAAGFDTTQADSMCVVQPPCPSGTASPENARRMLDQAVFLPFYEALPIRELDRMARIITPGKPG
ncbi:MAG: DegT/DnrJ/EryC1/StrS aminotransferase family protein [Planctomycetota bacterium]|nr:MAG: DegT/DnrJ/EryC1/StrS aminotransferase family protein [Planctomycetota bacterium]REK22782.1 MAG: DegT/DnrJ/EryC1/StrS aminotransferase family protein [Planctomycetota bacterium]REK33798.1 MAG: DegT/DnrJ/EryC1/StrS aminotransferase family protein [Planctomycetota bacterium]